MMLNGVHGGGHAKWGACKGQELVELITRDRKFTWKTPHYHKKAKPLSPKSFTSLIDVSAVRNGRSQAKHSMFEQY
jgi:hypothetical protein